MTCLVPSAHAIERFRERAMPDASIEDAASALFALQRNAKRLDERTPTGEELWELTDPPCLLVVRQTRTIRPTIVTVLECPLTKAPMHIRLAADEIMQIARRVAQLRGDWVPATVDEEEALRDLVWLVVDRIYGTYFSHVQNVWAHRATFADAHARSFEAVAERKAEEAREAEAHALAESMENARLRSRIAELEALLGASSAA